MAPVPARLIVESSVANAHLFGEPHEIHDVTIHEFIAQMVERIGNIRNDPGFHETLVPKHFLNCLEAILAMLKSTRDDNIMRALRMHRRLILPDHTILLDTLIGVRSQTDFYQLSLTDYLRQIDGDTYPEYIRIPESPLHLLSRQLCVLVDDWLGSLFFTIEVTIINIRDLLRNRPFDFDGHYETHRESQGIMDRSIPCKM